MTLLRPSRSRLLARLPARTVRLRLTLLYGALFTGCGAVLLTITYLLVSRSTNLRFVVRNTPSGPLGRPTAAVSRVPPEFQAQADQLRLLAERQHAAQLHELLVQWAIALAIMLTVTNTGPVIPPEQAARLFEPFQRPGRPGRLPRPRLRVRPAPPRRGPPWPEPAAGVGDTRHRLR